MNPAGIILHDANLGTCTITEEGQIQFWDKESGKLVPRNKEKTNAD
jgi:hypothetical protein